MKKLLLVIFIAIFIQFGCKKDPVVPINKNPSVSLESIPNILYLGSDSLEIVTVNVTDPDGRDDIKIVTCNIYPENSNSSVKLDTLFDDGITNGDGSAHNGIYTTQISSQFAQGTAGNYSIKIKAIDKSANESNIITHQLTVLDGVDNTAPSITNIEIPDSVDITINNGVIVQATANDIQGIADLDSVSMQVFYSDDYVLVLKKSMFDDGTNGDEIVNDGVFTYSIDKSFIDTMLVGTYYFSFQASDKHGAKSDKKGSIFKIFNSTNEPPEIIRLSAPDTMRLAGTGSGVKYAFLWLKVIDPQGDSDIKSTYFYSTKPNGVQANDGNPFYLVDDGQYYVTGDTLAGDSTYSYVIPLTDVGPNGEPALTGDYNFMFEAKDRSNAKSNQIFHTLTVIK